MHLKQKCRAAQNSPAVIGLCLLYFVVFFTGTQLARRSTVLADVRMVGVPAGVAIIQPHDYNVSDILSLSRGENKTCIFLGEFPLAFHNVEHWPIAIWKGSWSEENFVRRLFRGCLVTQFCKPSIGFFQSIWPNNDIAKRGRLHRRGLPIIRDENPDFHFLIGLIGRIGNHVGGPEVRPLISDEVIAGVFELHPKGNEGSEGKESKNDLSYGLHPLRVSPPFGWFLFFLALLMDCLAMLCIRLFARRAVHGGRIVLAGLLMLVFAPMLTAHAFYLTLGESARL